MNRRLLRDRPCLASLPVIFALISPVGCGVAKDGAETAGYDSLLAGEVSIWPDSTTPAVASASDPAAVELGVKFRSDSAGEVTGIRFYKGTGNTGTHVGHLWTSTGTLLGSVTFSGETASGWQTARFAAPIAVSANTTYVASYHAPAGRYAANNAFFASAGTNTPPLRALANGVDGSNGVYRYGPSGFPTSSYQSTNYWVDVVFRPAGTQSNGLTGQYFDNVDFTNLRLTRTDGSVNFSWGSGAPAGGIGADTFSVRWTGQVVPQYSQTYTFYTTSDDGVRLWVNGQALINNWTDHAPTENSGAIALTAGQRYDLRLEYYERGGGAVAQLAWSSASQPKQIIPQARLLPTSGTGTGGTGGAGGSSGTGGAAGTGGSGAAGGTSGGGGSGGADAGPPSGSRCPAYPAMPNAACTGVIPGTALTTCNGLITSSNSTYKNCLFPSGVIIGSSVKNVQISNSKIVGVISPQTTMPANMGLVLTDVEIDGKNADVAAWAFGAVTCVRCNVHNVARGFQYGGYTVIDSYIHDLYGFADSHNEAILVGGGNVVIRHSTLESNFSASSTGGGMSASLAMYTHGSFWGPLADVLIENSRIITSDAYYCVYGGYSTDTDGRPSNIRMVGNVFGPCSFQGPKRGAIVGWLRGNGNVWTNNSWDDGTPIPEPSSSTY